MNLPAIVRMSFEELRNRPEYIEIVNLVVNNLKKLSNGDDRAEYIHKVVDDYNTEVFSHPLVQQMNPCKLGCSACCHTQVSVTEDEARLLVKKIQEGISINKDLLKIQMTTENDSEEFFKLDFNDRRCIFLDDNGACQVYEDRPSVCRTNLVLGDSEQCDTRHGIKATRLVRTPKSDMAIYASCLCSQSSGALPHMVGELLESDL